MQTTMFEFIAKIGGADLLARELAEMAIQDQFTGLENRLARDLRGLEEKPFKVETVPSSFDNNESEGECYNDHALFFKNGSVEVVSYKGEGEAHFDSVYEYEQYIDSIINPCPYYNYFDQEEDGCD